MRLAAAVFASLCAFAPPARAGVASSPYEAGLNSYQPSAAKGFLADGPAQDALRLSNPGLLMPSLQRAHEILELESLPLRYDDPANLRRALIARDSEPSFETPALVRAYYESRPLSPAKKALVVRALAEWRTLDAELRGWLAQAGLGPKEWAAISVSERSAAIVLVLRDRLLGGRNLTLDGKAYRARAEEYARRAAPFLSAHDDYLLEEDLERHERLAAELRGARRRALAAGDADLGEALAAVARLPGVDEARGALDLLAETETPGTLPEKIKKTTVAAIARRLPDAVKAWAKGTPAEPVLAEALGAIRLESLPTSLGGYQNGKDRLIVSREHLALFVDSRGRRAADLLTDDALLAEFALEIAPIVVHETTHRLQKLRGDSFGLKALDAASLYGQEDEREAFTVQELFVRAFARRDPARAAALAKDDRLSFFWDPATIEKTLGALHLGYSNVPAAHGARARVATLARYRRAEAEKKPKSVELRPAAGLAGELASHDRFHAYLDAMKARLDAWTRRLRRARRP